MRSFRYIYPKSNYLVSAITSEKEIYAQGYQLNHVRYVKQKHIRWLVAHWRERQLSTGTVKNRLSQIRWLFAKINRELTVPSNEKLGIPQRVYVKNIDRSRELSQQDLSKVPDLLMRCVIKGGLKQKDMSVAQRQRDHAARLQVSLELGHTRINNITSQYLGR